MASPAFLLLILFGEEVSFSFLKSSIGSKAFFPSIGEEGALFVEHSSPPLGKGTPPLPLPRGGPRPFPFLSGGPFLGLPPFFLKNLCFYGLSARLMCVLSFLSVLDISLWFVWSESPTPPLSFW